jgi:hypothetical protein
MKIATYARASTAKQDNENQLAQLRNHRQDAGGRRTPVGLLRNQDFPNTDPAVEALEAVCRANNWDMENIENLSNAHAVAVRHGLYRPLSQDQIRASYAGPEPAHQPTPPPMIRSGNPDMERPRAEDPQTMPLDQLRN